VGHTTQICPPQRLYKGQEGEESGRDYAGFYWEIKGVGQANYQNSHSRHQDYRNRHIKGYENIFFGLIESLLTLEFNKLGIRAKEL